MRLKIGETFKYPSAKFKPIDPELKAIDGYPNYFFVTHKTGCKYLVLNRGINSIAKIVANDGARRAAVQISSSPRKAGTIEVPFRDKFDLKNALIEYDGDNKTPGKNPEESAGNKALLEQFVLHQSEDQTEREFAAPLVYWEKPKKGFVVFRGFGIIEGYELESKDSPEHSEPFQNFVFKFKVLSLERENGEFNWDWISARRNPDLTAGEANRFAPESWSRWVNEGVLECHRELEKKPLAAREARSPEKRTPLELLAEGGAGLEYSNSEGRKVNWIFTTRNEALLNFLYSRLASLEFSFDEFTTVFEKFSLSPQGGPFLPKQMLKRMLLEGDIEEVSSKVFRFLNQPLLEVVNARKGEVNTTRVGSSAGESARKLSNHSLNEVFVDALSDAGSPVEEVDLDSFPLEIDLKTPIQGFKTLCVYLFNLGDLRGGYRGEYRVRLGKKLDGLVSSDNRFVLFAGYQPGKRVFIFWDAAAHSDYSDLKKASVRNETIDRVLPHGYSEENGSAKLPNGSPEKIICCDGNGLTKALKERFSIFLARRLTGPAGDH